MIDTEALRKKVIDLAIQGKLTEQLPSDGDAETLYAQIQEEKTKLIKEGKIKKEKSLPPISDNETLFDIPSNWKWVRLASIGNFISGYTPSNDELYDEGNIPYFKVSDMNSEGNELYLSHTLLFLRGDSNIKQFSSNTIVYPKNGGALLTNKKRILAQNSVVDLNTGGFKPSQFLSIGYAYLLFLSIDFQDYHKGSAVPTLDMMKMRNTLVPLPPFAEQERIVETTKKAFDCVDDIKNFQQQYESNISVLKGKIIDAGIRGKLTEQLPEDGDAENLYLQIQEEKAKLIKEGKIKKEKPLPEIDADEIPFEIPKNWKWVRVSDIAYLSSGKPYEELEGGELYIKVSDMNLSENEKQIVTSKHFVDSKNDGIIPVNSIIFPKRGGAIATNKKRLILQTPVFVDLNTMGMSVLMPDIFLYVKFWFDTVKLDEIQNGTTIPQVNNKDIYPLILPLPPLAEQKRIIKKIEELIDVI